MVPRFFTRRCQTMRVLHAPSGTRHIFAFTNKMPLFDKFRNTTFRNSTFRVFIFVRKAPSFGIRARVLPWSLWQSKITGIQEKGTSVGSADPIYDAAFSASRLRCSNRARYIRRTKKSKLTSRPAISRRFVARFLARRERSRLSGRGPSTLCSCLLVSTPVVT